jgi:hypothetical protein
VRAALCKREGREGGDVGRLVVCDYASFFPWLGKPKDRLWAGKGEGGEGDIQEAGKTPDVPASWRREGRSAKDSFAFESSAFRSPPAPHVRPLTRREGVA